MRGGWGVGVGWGVSVCANVRSVGHDFALHKYFNCYHRYKDIKLY